MVDLFHTEGNIFLVKTWSYNMKDVVIHSAVYLITIQWR